MAAQTKHQTQAIPKDYGSATPFIIVKGAAKFLDFLKQAFDAKERARVPNIDGTIGHAEVWIGNRILMMFDSKKDWPPTPAFTMLYVKDCDMTISLQIATLHFIFYLDNLEQMCYNKIK